jgi:DNA-binding PadR family transcriptional regulator
MHGWGGGRRGWGPPFGPPFRGMGEGRRRRGDVRSAILALLAERPMHGYEMIQELEARTAGAWRPSAGSIYPTLQLLEDEGLVRSTERDGKRVFEITDAGRAEAERRIEDAGGTPWEVAGNASQRAGEFREAIGGLAMAFKQISMVGTPAQVEQAVGILRDARRQLYQLLAEA